MLCEKSVGQRAETKEAAAALNVVVCPSRKPQANHISLVFIQDGENTPERERFRVKNQRHIVIVRRSAKLGT